ncbi:MAG: VWA domain-containing protein [Candidatus Aminicenantes bacterium]|nr:VWA domain-containing protein [Candidatus Aminicenantes bacterium]NIM82978.1 VWA domain-containing protein [Candidatus Aminicenantes bacterium]NIN22363.1 VWA domain-containing protein [Candidatus Aminicenantes bacterium]NIN46123.1 VWA domain-containing protein [Candidatus Aminicenantes bacterium]NIN88959.1 VWA domain-containing protein [Candidatus Aminicenantes bacterium]
MTEFAFAYKNYLFLLAIVPLLILWNIFLIRRGKRFIFYSSKKIVKDSNRTVKTFFIKNLFYIKLIALILFIITLARPQKLRFFDKEMRKGIDIMITLDISGSMASVDFKPKNRLEVAKDVISEFIQKRTTDRLGLVVFAGQSYTKCPLTIDYDLLKQYLEQTSLGELEDGTALGMALATSANRIQYSKSKTKIIILLTDGINNRGEIDPRDAAGIAKELNVKVYTIGVGIRGKAPHPFTDAYGRTRYIMVDVQIDEKLLQEIANNTGGLYFRATDKDQLQQIFTEIDRWEKTEITTKRYHTARDIYIYFLIPALALLLLVEIAKRTVWRTLP